MAAENLFNNGVLHFRDGNLDEALRYFQKVLDIIPDHSYSYYFTGLIFKLKGENQKAIENLSGAIKLKGDDPNFYYCLGLIFDEEDQTDLAIDNFKTAIKITGKPEYYHSLGLVFHTNGMLKEAVENYYEAIKLDDNNHLYLNNLGIALDESNQADKAVNMFGKAISLNRGNPEYYHNMGLALSNIKEKIIPGIHDSYILRQNFKKRIDLAINNFLKAIKLNPKKTEYYSNLGIALQRIGNLEKAKENFLKAIELKPENGKYYNNLAIISEEEGNNEQAIKYFKKAIELTPENLETYQNLSFFYLIQENFKKGWENFELYRKEKPLNKEIRNLFKKPEWNGEDIRGKSIYVHWEQGLGDTIHFVRYLPFIKELGAKVIFNCHPKLLNLLKSFKGFDLIVSNELSEEKNEFDTFVLMMSLCRIFTPEFEMIQANIPYIYSSTQELIKWSEKFKNVKKLKIGFVWLAKYPHKTFNKRSCPVEKFVELASTFPEFMFYSLQKSPFESEINKFKLPNLLSFSEEINDFSDSAAILDHIDLLITIDTAITHLAGAMGKKVWNLIPFLPDWRWFLNRDNSPWYPAMRLIRQKKDGDWDSVFEIVSAGLKEIRDS